MELACPSMGDILLGCLGRVGWVEKSAIQVVSIWDEMSDE